MSLKKYLGAFVFLISMISILNSCAPDEPEFDRSLIIGKWASGTVFYRYDTDGAGATWDTSDDVPEEEATKFTWTLVKTDLTHIHISEMGNPDVPQVYEVIKLTATELSYKDIKGNVETFRKQ